MFWKLDKDFSFLQTFIKLETQNINNVIVKNIQFEQSDKKYNFIETINVKIYENLILYENKYCYSMTSIINDESILFQYKKLNINSFPFLLNYDFDENIEFSIVEFKNTYRIDENIKNILRSYEIKIV
jgi:hypothetical protein